jgi:hypothetical protein
MSIYLDRDPDWRAMDFDPQGLYLYLLRQPNTSPAGVLPIHLEKWAKVSPDMTVERTRAAANVLVQRRFTVADMETMEMLIRTYIRHDIAAQGSPKIMKGALNAALRTESAKLRSVLLSEIRKLDYPWSDDLLAVIDELEGSLEHPPSKAFQKAIDSQSKGCVAVAVEGVAVAVAKNEQQLCRLCEKPGVPRYDGQFCKEHGDEAAAQEMTR